MVVDLDVVVDLDAVVCVPFWVDCDEPFKTFEAFIGEIHILCFRLFFLRVVGDDLDTSDNLKLFGVLDQSIGMDRSEAVDVMEAKSKPPDPSEAADVC